MNPWSRVNKALIAKAISELHFEEVLQPSEKRPGEYELTLSSGAVYQFSATTGAWGHLWVDPQSLEKDSAGQFFIDSRRETGMSDITLANFLEEMHNTLLSDLKREEKGSLSVKEIAELSGLELERHLSGHPKLLLNKGRIGWGENDSSLYSPEAGRAFRLRWILVKEELLVGSEIEAPAIDIDVPEGFRPLPVHPWQWDRVIRLQFQEQIQNGSIVDLGERGDIYRPQVSLRTLSNVRKASLADIKLPLSILNTSCVRGLPHRYLQVTPELGLRLKTLIQNDELLSQRRVEVLQEKAAWGVRHPLYHQIEGASYRFHEQLGAVWRESCASKLNENEKAIIAAALFYQDREGQTLIGELVRRSGIGLKEWLRRYTQFVIVPFLHLQNKYGVGLVAHGQNVVIKLTDDVPTGLFLKDFHGDLRFSQCHQEIHREFFGELTQKMSTLPPEHLIHDLITGHFVTVLRFLSRALEASGEMTEKDFYHILATEIARYYRVHPCQNPSTNILAPTFSRVLVNRVRFKIGYGDSSERPLPLLGTELKNPLYQDHL